MSQALVDELKRENLCTHFVLPLLKLNKYSFIVSNFVDCYLTPAGDFILVRILEVTLLSRKELLHPMYRGLYTTHKGHVYLLYMIPYNWRNDVALFMKGKFSQMSKKAKEEIIRYSGLPYKERSGKSRIVTDGRLLALDRSRALKEMWERVLSSDDKRSTGRVVLKEEEELLSVPGKESYIEIEELILVKEA
jgi:hypothetical protein